MYFHGVIFSCVFSFPGAHVKSPFEKKTQIIITITLLPKNNDFHFTCIYVIIILRKYLMM